MPNLNKIDYLDLLERFPWLSGKESNFIISPDSDGFLCSLLLSHLNIGRVVGFYDAKILLVKKDVDPNTCIFIDVDINRDKIASIGHHMVLYNKTLKGIPNFNYQKCIQPNIIRNFDGKTDFQRKYPFGTIHLLLGILQAAKKIDHLSDDSIWPLLFADGVWNNLFGYTENCIEWMNYLGITDKSHILNPLFCSDDTSFFKIMVGLNDFLRIRDTFNATGYYDGSSFMVGGRNKRTGDKLRISNPSGMPINLEKTGDHYKIYQIEKDRIILFIKNLARHVGWDYKDEDWEWNDLRLWKFTKGDFSMNSLNNRTYLELMQKNPFSLAMTSGMDIEYTIEEPDSFL